MSPLDDLISLLTHYLIAGIIIVLCALALSFLGYLLFCWWRERDREKRSLNLILLQVALPKDNEIKIDAAEQLFQSLHALKKGGRFSFLKPAEYFTVEIVGRPEDIRFYIGVPREKQELVERQVYAFYPTAVITVVDEYNLFSKDGKVAYAAFQFRNSPFYPLKTYQDFSLDPLSSITSSLSKLKEGEAAAIQIIAAPIGGKWQKRGREFLAQSKKKEADPEKASFKMDPKAMEKIEEKCNKPGF